MIDFSEVPYNPMLIFNPIQNAITECLLCTSFVLYSLSKGVKDLISVISDNFPVSKNVVWRKLIQNMYGV